MRHQRGGHRLRQLLIARVEDELPTDSTIHTDPLFTKLRDHRKINHLNVVTSSLPRRLSDATDFSPSSIQKRIEAGYQDAIEQGIGDGDAPGLRSGVTSAAAERVGGPG